MQQPNLKITGVGITPCKIDKYSGAIVTATPKGVPVWMEFHLKDGNDLIIYADGDYSDYDAFEFTDGVYRPSWVARRWVFEQYFEENFTVFYQCYRLVRWLHYRKRRAIIWWLNYRNTEPGRTYI